MILIAILSLWAVSKFYSWYLPSPETASSFKRLTGLLALPIYFVVFVPLVVVYFLLVGVIKKMMRLGPWSEDRDSEAPGVEREKATEKGPSTLPYWFLIIFMGGLFLTGLFFIVQDMLIRHFPGEDWVIVGLALLTLGAPAMIGVLRIRDINKGIPQPPDWRQAQKPMSPLAGAILVGFIVALLLGAGSFSVWRITQFLKTALPATGVVTRWIHHSSGGSGYDDLEVCFTTQKGVKLTLESQNHSGLEFLRPNVGQTVKVLYDPMEPADFRVDQFSELWSGPILAFLIGLVFSVAGIIGYKRRIASQRV